MVLICDTRASINLVNSTHGNSKCVKHHQFDISYCIDYRTLVNGVNNPSKRKCNSRCSFIV